MFVLFIDITFPKKYPTGCLMGCVNIVDCLSHEEYIEQFPQGENDSPFIFLCENPIMMSNHFPIKGQHKICECSKSKLFYYFIDHYN